MFWPRLTPTFCTARRTGHSANRISALVAPTTSRLLLRVFALGAALSLPAAPALAATCGTGNFDAWLTSFKSDAAAKGISQAAIAAGLNGVTLDQNVLARDHSQKVFSQSFEEFFGRVALAPHRLCYRDPGHLPVTLRFPPGPIKPGDGARFWPSRTTGSIGFFAPLPAGSACFCICIAYAPPMRASRLLHGI